MASKRQIKKQIRYFCGDIAGECILAKALIPNVDAEKMNEVIIAAANLQEAALMRVNVTFDKVPRDFENRAEFNKARHAYYVKAYKALRDGFNKQIEAIVKDMNAAMPKKEK